MPRKAEDTDGNASWPADGVDKKKKAAPKPVSVTVVVKTSDYALLSSGDTHKVASMDDWKLYNNKFPFDVWDKLPEPPDFSPLFPSKDVINMAFWLAGYFVNKDVNPNRLQHVLRKIAPSNDAIANLLTKS